MPNIISAFWAIIVIASPKAATAATPMMMTAWTATAAMPRATTIAVMTAINAVMSAPAMTGPAMTAPVTNVRVTSARAKIVPVKSGHVKIVAPTATAVIGSVIAVIAGRNAQSSRGIRIQLMHRRSMTANRFCRRCPPPSRAARALA